MKNPFSFSGIVGDPSFCNRQKELADLKNYIAHSQNVLLYSHRRFGKSSLIHKAFSDLKDTTAIYVDLYGTTSVEDFITALFKGISTVESSIEKLMKLLKEKISRFTMNFSIDVYTGAPVAVPVFAPVDQKPALDETFALLETLSGKKKLVVAFDEFQEISRYGDPSFEKHLRKSIQWHEKISYVFAGSQRHLLTEMFSDSKRAFYKLAVPYPLKKIETKHYVEWVRKLYVQDGRSITPKHVEYIVNRCENHPMYVQEFFFHLWNHPSGVSMESIDHLELEIINHRETEFINIWDSLTLNQRKTLKLIAVTGGKNIFSAANLSRAALKTASQVAKAIEILEKRELVGKNGTYSIQDPIFLRWIKKIPGASTK